MTTAYVEITKQRYLTLFLGWSMISRERKRHLFAAWFFFFAMTNAIAAGTLSVLVVRVYRPSVDVFSFLARPLSVQGEGLTYAYGPTVFDAIIEREAEAHGVDPLLLKAVIRVESNFHPRAVSHKGAQGLMQLMPETARVLGVKDAFSPEENIRGGTEHLGKLLVLYRGDLERALAAYNAGAEAVRFYGGIPPYAETQAYVRHVLAFYRNQ